MSKKLRTRKHKVVLNRSAGGDAGITIVLTILGAFMFLPMVYVVMQSLKPSRDELTAVESIQKYGNAPETFAEKPLDYAVKLLMKAGGDDFPKRIALYRQALGTMDDMTAQAVIHTAAELREQGVCVRLAELAVTGGDLMPLGFAGPALGKTLNALLDRVMRGELENDRSILIEAAEKERNG